MARTSNLDLTAVIAFMESSRSAGTCACHAGSWSLETPSLLKMCCSDCSPVRNDSKSFGPKDHWPVQSTPRHHKLFCPTIGGLVSDHPMVPATAVVIGEARDSDQLGHSWCTCSSQVQLQMSCFFCLCKMFENCLVFCLECFGMKRKQWKELELTLNTLLIILNNLENCGQKKLPTWDKSSKNLFPAIIANGHYASSTGIDDQYQFLHLTLTRLYTNAQPWLCNCC